ncbi:hypothetical protein WR25_08201 isoform C [Diploscapter pachys]|nr:hypothetical protein WR25_08201 isoform B [Diploscapter pachys]PAV59613.1 hypothetical protein WR25_08201 isoform C [Diploscapter pachys]
MSPRSRVSSFNRLGESDEELSNRHTTLRYRRRRGGVWRQVRQTDTIRRDDEDELEVDVKEELSGDTGIITTTYEARWKVLKYEHLPEWLQDNEFLRHGHRPPMPSFSECFKSVLSLHTETGNIWTHLLGCIAFFILAIWFFTRPENHIQLQEKIVFSFFFAGAVLCLGLSFAFHTLSCHSINIGRLFCKLDYMGISLLIVGSFIPWIYYGFYCRREPKITYIAMVCVLGAGAIIVSLWDKFSEPLFRPFRAGVFVGMGCSGVIPTIHYIITDGVQSLFQDNAFHWLLLMAFLYLLGALLYATRTPERFFPGKCDIWFQSHQLFHTCVVIAAFIHYYGISEMAMVRLNSQCPAIA